MKTTQRIGAMLLISSMLLTGVSVAEEPSNPPAATEALVTAAPTEAPTATPAPENPAAHDIAGHCQERIDELEVRLATLDEIEDLHNRK